MKKFFISLVFTVFCLSQILSSEVIKDLRYEDDFWSGEKKVWLIDENGEKNFGYYDYSVSYGGGGYNYTVWNHQVKDYTLSPFKGLVNMNVVLRYAINARSLTQNAGWAIASAVNALFMIPGFPMLDYGDTEYKKDRSNDTAFGIYIAGLMFAVWGATYALFFVIFGVAALINLIVSSSQKARILKTLNGELTGKSFELKPFNEAKDDYTSFGLAITL